jgi:hypothetical protein
MISLFVVIATAGILGTGIYFLVRFNKDQPIRSSKHVPRHSHRH